MTDHPIRFSAPMVRALLEGRKTQTRRLVKMPARRQFEHPEMGGWHADTIGGEGVFTLDKHGVRHDVPLSAAISHRTSGATIAAPWRVGDRVWVRETWGINDYRYMRPAPIPKARPTDIKPDALVYFASEDDAEIVNEMPRTPSLFMPRWASRLTLTVTDVRVQRLLEIGNADAEAEGFIGGPLNDGFTRTLEDGTTISSPGGYASAAGMFQIYWAKLHTDWDGFSDPWVWALTFTVAQQNIDAREAA